MDQNLGASPQIVQQPMPVAGVSGLPSSTDLPSLNAGVVDPNVIPDLAPIVEIGGDASAFANPANNTSNTSNGLPSLDPVLSAMPSAVVSPLLGGDTSAAVSPPVANIVPQTILPSAPPSVPQAAQPTVVNNNVSVLGQTDILQAMVLKGIITTEQVDQVRKAIAMGTKTVEGSLQEDIKIDDELVVQIKAEMAGMEYVDLSEVEFDANILNKISSEQARKDMAIAFAKGTQGLKVAMVDPLDIQKVKYLTAVIGQTVEPVYATAKSVQFVIDNRYGAQVGSEVAQAMEDVSDTGIQLGSAVSEVTDLENASDLANAPVSKIVNMVLEYAIRYKASDVHIEPRESKISVRFRIYGVLAEKLTLPRKLHAAVVSRIKILASLKIDEHRVPQDGRFQVKLDKDQIDLRVSVVPTVYGEKIVMRLLQKGGGAIDLPATGVRGHAFKIFNEALRKTQGIVLVTGPTGSGKTQTLASCLKILNTPEVNIMTLEDPVEIRVDGVNQVQINADVGLTFAKGLRSFLRQDPNVILIGEIRDSETASLAVQAALTGHLVLATLHTNSAATAPSRLLDMEVEPFLLASTMNVVLAQRLVRKICLNCKEAYYADLEVTKAIHKIMDGIKTYDIFKLPNNDPVNPQTPDDDKIVLYRGKGCSKCNDTGYTGRIGIFEALDINEGVSKLMLQRASGGDIQKAALANGMVTMIQDGFMKAIEGITTIEEVMRVQTV